MNPQDYLNRFFITADDIAVLHRYKDQVLPIVSPTIASVVANINEHNKTGGIPLSAEMLEGYWISFWTTDVDEARIRNSIETGRNTAAMGVPISTFTDLGALFRHVFCQAFQSIGITEPALYVAFCKMHELDLFIIIQEYNAYIIETMRAQNSVLMEMSTPIAQLWDEILMLPLVGIMDSKRTKEVMTNMLTSISEKQAKVFILDISGIAVVDTAVANYFIRMSQAAQLMGCQCIISGISPAVAETMVALGIQLEQIRTTGSMKDALLMAFEIVKAKIVREV